MFERIKNLFNRNKTDIKCTDCNTNLQLVGKMTLLNGQGIYYLKCPKCQKEYQIWNI